MVSLDSLSDDIIGCISRHLGNTESGILDIVALSTTNSKLSKIFNDDELVRFILTEIKPSKVECFMYLNLIKETKWESLKLKYTLYNPDLEYYLRLEYYDIILKNTFELTIENLDENMESFEYSNQLINFSNLKKLTFKNCPFFNEFPILPINITCLEFINCEHLYWNNKRQNLNKTESLYFENCPCIGKFPILPNLKKLSICNCFGCLDNIKYMNLDYFKLKNNNYNDFDLNCKLLENIPNIELTRICINSIINISSCFKKVVNLSIIGSYGITDISGLENLKSLKVSSCYELNRISNLKNLEKLHIHNCNKLENLDILNDFDKLKDIKVTGNPNIENQLDLIKLKLENKKLKLENEKLKKENQKLKLENQKLKLQKQ
jgi:hypothetical protein